MQDTENATSFDVQLSSLSELNKYSLDETPKILSQLSSYYGSLTSRSKSGLKQIIYPDAITPLLLNPLNSNSPSLLTGSDSIIESLTGIKNVENLKWEEVDVRMVGMCAVTVNLERREEEEEGGGRRKSRFAQKTWRNVIFWRKITLNDSTSTWRAILINTESGTPRTSPNIPLPHDPRQLRFKKEKKEDEGKGKIIISSLGSRSGTSLGGLLGLGSLVEEEEDEDGEGMGGWEGLSVGRGGRGGGGGGGRKEEEKKTSYLESKVIKDIKR
ncbi:hypothetical protein TL16_g04270 [Triparma laevis f. inornata]|nr:hypothetical protein TL16_g04270 [Triparma laevis f. inornata]GMI13773.1 hypothetical protein TrLO_g12116 [Triparma laevis f. longispina]